MKDRLFIAFFYIAACVLLPLCGGGTAFAQPTDGLPENFTVLISQTGEVLTMTAGEYLVGCLAAQIPLDYEQEALNAQAAAAYTYALRLVTDFPRTPKTRRRERCYRTTAEAVSRILRPKSAAANTARTMKNISRTSKKLRSTAKLT